MRRLPLYPDGIAAPAETAPAKTQNSGCTACPLHKGVNKVCMPPGETEATDDSEPTLLVLGGTPRQFDDINGEPFSSSAGLWIRKQVEPLWKGRVVYTYGLRCSVGASDSEDYKDESVEACRGYLRTVLAEVKPTRILMVGATAAEVLLGRRPYPQYVRTGYAHLESGAVAYFMPDPANGTMRNYYHTRDWRADVRKAMLDPLPPPPPVDAYVNLVETEEDALLAERRVFEHGSMAYDTEHSGGLHTEYFATDTVAVALTGTAECYVWDDGAYDDPDRRSPFDNPAIVAPLRRIVEDIPERVAHNGKVELKSCHVDARMGFTTRLDVVDTLVQRKVAHPDYAANLEVTEELVGMGGHKHRVKEEISRCVEIVKQVRAEAEAGHKHIPRTLPRPLQAALAYPGLDPKACAYGLMNPEVRATYCGSDAISTGLLKARTDEDVTDLGLQTVLKWLRRVPRTVAHIECAGMLVDKKQIRAVYSYVTKRLDKLAFQLAADGLKEPSKGAQVVEYLFEKHKLPVQGRTKTGQPSVDAAALDKLTKLKDKPAGVDAYIEWKKLDTLRIRYSLNLLDFIRADGRIHGSFNANGTETGRWSSSDPNLQNQPSRGDEAKMVKNIFVARKGYTLIQCDMSQIEYRVAALLARDTNWVKTFQDGKDLHTENALQACEAAWGITREDALKLPKGVFKKQLRSPAKTVGFGSLYGKVAVSFAKEWGLLLPNGKPDVDRAQRIVDALLPPGGGIRRWIEEQHKFVAANGYVTTYIDGKPARRRPLYGIADEDRGLSSAAERRSVNSSVQGTAADYMMRSLVTIVDWLEEDEVPAQVIGTVHDSVIIEVRNDYLDEVAWKCQAIMESWWCGEGDFAIPLKADLEHGPTWGQLQESHLDDHGHLVYTEEG